MPGNRHGNSVDAVVNRPVTDRYSYRGIDLDKLLDMSNQDLTANH